MRADFSADINLAKHLSIQKKYKEAHEKYMELLGQIENMNCMQQVMVFGGLGHISRIKLLFSEAVEYFEKALELEPKNRFALNGIANSYRGLKNRSQEIHWWKQLLSYHPHDFLAMNRLADAYRHKNDNDQAEILYLQSLELKHNNKFALMGLGDLYFKQKKYNLTLKYWEKLLTLHPEFINVMTMVANIYRMRKDFSNALYYYKKAYEIAPSNNYVLFGIADTLRGQRLYRESIPYWEQCLNNNKNDTRVLTRLGDMYMQCTMIEEAEKVYIKAWEQNQDKYGYLGLIKFEAFRKNYQKVIEMIQKILETSEAENRVVTIIVEILFSIGHKDKIYNLLSPYVDLKDIGMFSRLMVQDTVNFRKNMDTIGNIIDE